MERKRENSKESFVVVWIKGDNCLNKKSSGGDYGKWSEFEYFLKV